MPNHDDHGDHGDHEERGTIDLTPAQQAVVADIAAGLAGGAPAGWLRLVSRQECSTAAGSAGVAGAQVVVLATADGLVQDHLGTPSRLYFTIDDLLEELADASPTGGATLELVVDRDGTYEHRVLADAGRALDGDRSELRTVYDYLDAHRAELEELAARG